MNDGRILATPSAAANAYARVQGQDTFGVGVGVGVGVGAEGEGLQAGTAGSFGDTLSQALAGVVESGHAADAAAAKGMTGHGNLTEVVMAVSKAQLALQSTTAIRDRVVQAYQDIMKMSI